jgi:uncharacterized protein (TIGR02246 family)
MEALARAEVLDLYQRRRRAWLEGDARAYLDLWAEDMVIELPGRAEPIRGKAAYAELIEQSFRGMKPVAWEFHRLAIDGDHVLSEWTISGERRDAGKIVTWRGMSICRLEGGLIREWREYWDPASLRR